MGLLGRHMSHQLCMSPNQLTMRPNQVMKKTFHGLMFAGRRQLKSAAIGAQPADEEKTIPCRVSCGTHPLIAKTHAKAQKVTSEQLALVLLCLLGADLEALLSCKAEHAAEENELHDPGVAFPIVYGWSISIDATEVGRRVLNAPL